jgi:L-ribulokinase
MARQHPLDYIESTREVLQNIMRHCTDKTSVKAIALDTTASTPCLVDKTITPLALNEAHKDNPDAMFVLWKDHTAAAESSVINNLLKHGEHNYAIGSGGCYSPEFYWAKVAHVLNSSPELDADTLIAMELCDWIPALLCGIDNVDNLRINASPAIIKQMWDYERGTFPPDEFMSAIHPSLPRLAGNMPTAKLGCDKIAGTLSDEWAEATGLPTGIPVGIGNIDSYSGGVGGGICDGTVVLNLGTSACFLIAVPPEQLDSKFIPDMFGQGINSILPGYMGLETGLSAFGDVFAWLKNLLGYGRKPEETDRLLAELGNDAAKLTPRLDRPIATDHLNGRRAPDPNLSLKGIIAGLSLATSAPELYYSLVEATAFAARRVFEHLADHGVTVNRMIAIGGISKKAPFVMQMLADVIGSRIDVSDSSFACSRGSAIHAAVIAGIYPTVKDAVEALKPGTTASYTPNTEYKEIIDARYKRYLECVEFASTLC